jgi:hypothetical protein
MFHRDTKNLQQHSGISMDALQSDQSSSNSSMQWQMLTQPTAAYNQSSRILESDF